MGINIGICEMDAKNALCRELKSEIVKVYIENIEPFKDIACYDQIVDIDDAKKAVGDWEAFLKRNRIDGEAEQIYLMKVKKEDDYAKLEPLAKKIYNGWIDIKDLPEATKKKVLAAADESNIHTGWDLVGFDVMKETCAECKLSWDKGRGCMGAFGPDTSKLPEIAEKYGCPITASALKSSQEQKKFTPNDAEALLKEVEILRDALPKEGKVFVNRYGGPVDRMEAVAKISISEGCNWYFF